MHNLHLQKATRIPRDLVREKLRNRETFAEDRPETTATGHRKVATGLFWLPLVNYNEYILLLFGRKTPMEVECRTTNRAIHNLSSYVLSLLG